MIPGTYILNIKLSDIFEAEIGKLGKFHFPKGTYLYAGSALGGLKSRLLRHLRGGCLHWHIDHLLLCGHVDGAWILVSERRLECLVADTLSEYFWQPVRSLGSSDCNFFSHLFYAPVNSDLTDEIPRLLNLSFSDVPSLHLAADRFNDNVLVGDKT